MVEQSGTHASSGTAIAGYLIDGKFLADKGLEDAPILADARADSICTILVLCSSY